MALLHRLAREPGVELVVAHFDHGMRPDSALDRQLVQDMAAEYNLPFEFAEGNLGPAASEATAREARYKFLKQVQASHQAKAIITAHHQDDVIETALLNMLRGTGRKGLVSLKSRPGLIRPLLDVSKKDLKEYAAKNKLEWREDSTNQDSKYLRNYVRLQLVPKLTRTQKQQLLESIETTRVQDQAINQLIDQIIKNSLKVNDRDQNHSGQTLDRQWFISLPHQVALEVMAHWLRQNKAGEISKQLLERLVNGAKTKQPGKLLDVDKKHVIKVTKTELALQARER
jgi:tRNA(Ile)-lysidine synthase